MEKRLITAALPYVNNIPHLGNLIQVLSADVYARYCRLRGYETLYVCGTDEYGTATETKAKEEGISPKELCDRFHHIHKDIYQWFNISFDHFGRTSTEKQTQITQDLFLKLEANGYIKEEKIEQLFCEKCESFLADRYVLGTCPNCGYEEARGDQCENCGKLHDTTDLKDPKCSSCGSTPVLKETHHLYLDLPGVLPKLEAWMKKASVDGFWAKNSIQMTNAWIRDGLKLRCITRDLKWGIPVPKDGFRDKVFYVWFDAPIGYISITANLTDQWESWWKDPENVNLYQFLGKDNIPFHTVIFPTSLLGSGENWTMLHHMSSSEYLNYENTKFSKSKGVGVFGNDAKETGIPADLWRFYIYYNRPEKSDTQFTWKDFQEKVNGELINNLSNLVNRTLTFVNRTFKGELPEGQCDTAFWEDVAAVENEIQDDLEKVNIRDAFRQIFHLSSIGNKRFQDAEPWKLVKEDPAKAAPLLKELLYLIRDLAILISPYIPETAEKIASFLGGCELKWENLGKLEGITKLGKPALLFKKLEDKEIEGFRAKFAGSQKERKTLSEQFKSKVCLKVAKILEVEQHPNADKLYIEKIDMGGEERQIVSGLVPYYKPEELEGKHVIVVANLKPAKLRKVLSQGMLLAADNKETVEVIFVEGAQAGDRIILEDDDSGKSEYDEITIDEFFDIPITAKDHNVYVENSKLVCNGTPVKTVTVSEGEVG